MKMEDGLLKKESHKNDNFVKIIASGLAKTPALGTMSRIRWAGFLPWRGFYEALRQGDADHVKACLDNRTFDIRLPVARKRNALEFAAYHGQVNVVDTILSSRQFRSLDSCQQQKLFTRAFMALCRREGNLPMMTYFLTNGWWHRIYHGITTQNSLRDQIFRLCLGPDCDGILDYLVDGVHDYDDPNFARRDQVVHDLVVAFYRLYESDLRIRRQEVVWIMRKYNLSVAQASTLLQTEPIMLQCCIGDVEVVDRLLDQWFDSEKFVEWTKLEFSLKKPLRLQAGVEYHRSPHEAWERPEMIAARSGRADIVKLFLEKTRDKLFSPGKDACRHYEQVWRRMLWTLVDENVHDVSVLETLPQEAFYIDGVIPDSDGFHGLPWFFLGGSDWSGGFDGSGGSSDQPCTARLRYLLATALLNQNWKLFEFYVNKYKIHEYQLRFSLGTDRYWYQLPEDGEDYDIMGRVDTWMYFSDFDPCKAPVSFLQYFPLDLILRFASRDKDSLRQLVLAGDVRMIQLLQTKLNILDEIGQCAGGRLYDGVVEDPRGDESVLLPIPALEYVAEYYDERSSLRAGAVRRNIARQFLNARGGEDFPHPFPDYTLPRLYAKEAMKIILTRFPVGGDEPMDFVPLTGLFKTKRYAKSLKYLTKKQIAKLDTLQKTKKLKKFRNSHSDFLLCKQWMDEDVKRRLSQPEPPHTGQIAFPSTVRENLLTVCLVTGTLGNDYMLAKLLAAMEVHDFSQDFGPVMIGTRIRVTDPSYAEDRRIFLRDFVLGLCGADECYLYWEDFLMYLAEVTDRHLDTHSGEREEEVFRLLAITGIVVVDTLFHKPRRNVKSCLTTRKNMYLDAMAREHPEITQRRRELSLASHCRIAVHRSLRLSCRTGFQSDKIRELELPCTVKSFLMFDEFRDDWDRKYGQNYFIARSNRAI